MNPDLEGSVYSIPSSIYPFPSVAEAPSAVLHWQAGDHGSGTGSPLLPQRDRLPRYRTLTENELAEGDDGIAIAGRKGPGAASLQHASKPSSLRTAQSMPTLASNRGKRKNADTSAGVVADSHEKDAGAALSRTMSSTDQRREIVGTDPAGRQSPSRQTSRTKAKTTSREPAHASGSGAVHQTHAEGEWVCFTLRCQVRLGLMVVIAFHVQRKDCMVFTLKQQLSVAGDCDRLWKTVHECAPRKWWDPL